MAQHYSPKIVTDGLVLCLDAASRKSYPGSGTVWNDLSPNLSIATMFSLPSYNSGNAGSLTFNGSNQYCTVPGPVSGTNMTASLWCYPTTSGAYMDPLTNMNYDNVTNGYQISQRNDGTFYTVIGIAGVGADGVTSIPYTTNTWLNLTMTYNGSTIIAYKNGTYFGQAASTRTFPAGTLNIGKGPTGLPYYFNGRIACITFYNRPLSALEVSQNFNATRGRFGI